MGYYRDHYSGEKAHYIREWLQRSRGEWLAGPVSSDRIDWSSDEREYDDDSVFNRPLSRTDSGIEIVDTPPCEPLVSPSVLQARRNARAVLNNCRSSLLSLELTRMQKSRIGLRNWIAFWHRIYSAKLAKVICSMIAAAAPKIDKVFRSVAKALFDLSYQTGKNIEEATTDELILRIWEVMERQTIAYREVRDRYVNSILEDLRVRIEYIPVDITDELFDDLKRAIFYLDPFGNYHPGSREAEERDWQSHTNLHAGAYLRSDPDLVERPGFRPDFQIALQTAANQMTEQLPPLELSYSNQSATTGEWTEEVLSDLGITTTEETEETEETEDSCSQ
ncbi:hypothetical protein FQN50_006465 [Emmonsiellopsis sp. PD_5]|nr:hypothetical protein FQN50_006465 [Emmonsiellopsis sp. PD_5]